MEMWQPTGAFRRVPRRHLFAATTTLALAWLVAPASTLAQNAYITNTGSNTVSVIDTATDTVTASIPVGTGDQ